MGLSPDGVSGTSLGRTTSEASTFSSLSVGSTATLLANADRNASSSSVVDSSRSPQTTADTRVRSEVTRFIVKPVPALASHAKSASHRLSLLPTTLLGKPHHVSVLFIISYIDVDPSAYLTDGP